MANPQLPTVPFGKIALSCSGGGYRAASFHLGSMSYLNRLRIGEDPLLEHVKLISTVSGGTITGAVYALLKQQGYSFEGVYQFLLDRLINIDLLHRGIEDLNPNKPWPFLYKRKNLINAFAVQYDKEFTAGATMDVFAVMKSHLEAVVFNCTEFDHAVNFRFRNAGWSYSGNYYTRIPAKLLSEVKLSDVMASSSCFPGGFEPMCWPNDYVHDPSSNLASLAKRNAEAGISPMGVMDGGIYDNQGIDSIMRYKERSGDPYFDLVIISDVASPDMKPFRPYKEQPKTGFRALTVKQLKTRIANVDCGIAVVLCTVFFLGIIAPYVFNMHANWLAGVCWTLSFFALMLLWLRSAVKKAFRSLLFKVLLKIRALIPAFFLKRLGSFDVDELSIHRAEPLIMDRVNALVTLLTDVFLKVVRRLNYNRLYENEAYHYRRFSTLIKSLTRADLTNDANAETGRRKGFFSGNYDSDVGPAIEAIVESAAAFGTTLWFTEQEKMDNVMKKLVATGQITVCYNMILYIEQLRSAKDGQYDQLDPLSKKNIDSLYDQCISDWTIFKADPLHMVQIRTKEESRK